MATLQCPLNKKICLIGVQNCLRLWTFESAYWISLIWVMWSDGAYDIYTTSVTGDNSGTCSGSTAVSEWRYSIAIIVVPTGARALWQRQLSDRFTSERAIRVIRMWYFLEWSRAAAAGASRPPRQLHGSGVGSRLYRLNSTPSLLSHPIWLLAFSPGKSDSLRADFAYWACVTVKLRSLLYDCSRRLWACLQFITFTWVK